jgi:hypothetical protein
VHPTKTINYWTYFGALKEDGASEDGISVESEHQFQVCGYLKGIYVIEVIIVPKLYA